MKQILSKKEYYAQVTPKKSIRIWWIVALVINIIGVAMGPASILGVISCIVCWVGGNASCNKWWGVALAVCGAIQFILIYVIGGVMPWVMLFVGVYMYQIYDNLDKAYAAYLETGEIPDLKGV